MDAGSGTDDGATEDPISLGEPVEEQKPVVKKEPDFVLPAGDYDFVQDQIHAAPRIMREYIFEESAPYYGSMVGVPIQYSFLSYPNTLVDWIEDASRNTDIKEEEVGTKLLWGEEPFGP
jgi:hypothetical protein